MTEAEKIEFFCRKLVKEESWETLETYFEEFVVDAERDIEILKAPLNGYPWVPILSIEWSDANVARERLRARVLAEIVRRGTKTENQKNIEFNAKETGYNYANAAKSLEAELSHYEHSHSDSFTIEVDVMDLRLVLDRLKELEAK